MNEPKRTLQDEAERRSEWRGDEDAPQPEANGHTLPASEEGADLIGDIPEQPLSHPGTIPPPD